MFVCFFLLKERREGGEGLGLVDVRGAAMSARGLAGENLVGKAPKNSLGLCAFASPPVLHRPQLHGLCRTGKDM